MFTPSAFFFATYNLSETAAGNKKYLHMERLNDVVNRTINKEPLKESSIEFCANQGREVAEVSPNLSLSPMINPVGTGVAATAASGTAAAVVFPPKPWKSQAEIVRHAVRGGARSLLTMYLMRGGVTVIIKLLPLLKGKIKLLQALEPMWRMETLRFAAVFGGFNFIWRLVNNLLIFHRKQNDRWNGFISGSIAALAILFETKENRIGMAQQFFVRGMQATYNALHARNYVSLTHGDSLLFMVNRFNNLSVKRY